MKNSKNRMRSLLAAAIIAVVLAGCGAANVTTSAGADLTTSSQTTVSTAATTNTAVVATPSTTVADALAEKAQPHDASATAASSTAAEVSITLNGDAIAADAAGVTVNGSVAQITAPGTYRISGTLANGQISVNVAEDGVVTLILDGANIHNETGAAIDIVEAETVAISLADGSQNTLSDGKNYVFASADVDEPNATLFSKADLTIEGAGALTVQGNFNDGIASKDGLVIAGGNITVTAADDGIRGKDYLVVRDGTLNVTAGGDGLKSDNEEDAAKGYIEIEDGVIVIDAGGDAIQAQTDVLLAGGNFTLTAGGGSQNAVDDAVSTKGIKAVVNLTIDGGQFKIDSSDDALHSNTSISINAGTFELATNDDAVHADAALTINGGTLNITRSVEGIESAVITLNGGDITVNSSDDAINAAGGSNLLYVHGGNIVVYASGDGVDVNGSAEMTGGTVLVHGPTQTMNGALDYDGTFNISGGTLVAAGSAGMSQAPGASSTQASVLIFFTSVQPAGTLVHIQNAAGENVLTFAPDKDFQSLAFSSPVLVQGQTYQIVLGGSATGTPEGGLYSDTTYTAGTAYQQFTVSGATTTVGSGGNMRQRGPRP